MYWLTLGGWRRTDADGRRETGRLGGRFGNDNVDRLNKDRKRTIGCLLQDSRVGHGANRALVAGNARGVGVYVIRLDKPDEAYKQHAEQG
jgi:hypothetical protein